MTPGPVPAASTLWTNLEALLARRLPLAWAQTVLGVWGGFGVYARPLEEFSWPGAAALAALEWRAGLRLRPSDDAEALLRRLLRGGEAVAAVDAFHLPYRPAFGRVHATRTILVRGGGAPGRLHVDDRWPPVWAGEIDRADFERAHASRSPAEPVREPLFSGAPAGRRWWSVPDRIAPPTEPDAWLAARLADLHADLEGSHAAGAFALLAEDLGAEGGSPALCRRVSLTLRAETSARLYRAHLIALAAHRLADGWLRVQAERQRAVLQGLGLARDVLAKAVVLPRPQYLRIAVAALAEARQAETALQAALLAYAAPPRRVQPAREAALA